MDQMILIFDMDGVIVNTAQLKISIFRKLGIRKTDEELLKVSRPSELLEEGLAHEYSREYDIGLEKCQRFIENEELMTLKNKGYQIALMTTQPRRRVHMLFPESLFEIVITEENLRGRTKTEANAVRLVTDGPAIVIGDTDDDMQAAKRAGAIAIFAGWGYGGVGGHLRVDSPKQLTRIIEEINENRLLCAAK